MTMENNDALAVLAKGSGLMAYATETASDLPDVGDEGVRFPGMKLVHKLAEDFDAISQAGIKHGQMVLMNADLVYEDLPRYIQIPDNSVFLMLEAFGPFWSKYNGDGQDSELSWKEPADNRSRAYSDKAKEHMILLGLVVTPDGKTFPVRFWGRNWNQIKEFKKLVREVRETEKESWATQSPDHAKAAEQVAFPRFRVVLPLTVKLENGKTGGTYGQLASPGPRPVRQEEGAAIRKWSEAGEMGLAEAREAYDNLVDRQKEGLGDPE